MNDLNKSDKIDTAVEQPATEQLSRRETAKKLVKMAYVVPAVLAVIKTTERPALAGFSTGPPPATLPPPQ
ncbi:MAG: hypothetical protein O2968_09560 [Acidobacteria bacterium]|nr:hypothetical protein [Acidobacteriota bacterium]